MSIANPFVNCPSHSPTGHIHKVSLVDKDKNPLNVNNAVEGCSNFLIPYCTNYILQERQGSKIDFICNECDDGKKNFSSTVGTILKLYDGIS